MKNAVLLLLLVVSSVFAAEPVLVGHWTLDDKDGDVVVDSSSSKNNAKAMNAPTRVPGKVGGAFAFDGKKQFIEIPNTKELEKLHSGSYTMAVWFKADNAPPGTEDANDAQYALVVRTGHHEGLSYDNNKKFIFTHWLKGEPDPAWTGIGTWDTEYDPGAWQHIVGVVDTKARVAKIFVNGELKGTTNEWDEKAVAKDFEATVTWKIGVGSPSAEKWAWHAKAAIDDVRLYSSALTDDQVKALFDSTNAGK